MVCGRPGYFDWLGILRPSNCVRPTLREVGMERLGAKCNEYEARRIFTIRKPRYRGRSYLWVGDLPMDVNRGPLAGRISGEYNDLSMQVLTVLLNWKM